MRYREFRTRMLSGVMLLLASTVSAESTGGRDCPSRGIEALRSALKMPGAVVLMRHADKRKPEKKCGGDGFADCKCTNQPLSDEGRQQAREIGKATREMRDLKLGEVHASPYCRTLETALLAFGKATKEPELGIDATLQGNLLDEIKEWSAHDSESLTVVVTHSPKIVSIGKELKWNFSEQAFQEGQAAIFNLVDGKLELIACLKPDEWEELIMK